MNTESILAELGFGPAELERKAQQTEARQLKRWGASGVEMMNVPMQTPPFDPDDPKELRATLDQLYEETAKAVGSPEAHRRLRKKAYPWQAALEGGTVTKLHNCEVCNKPFPGRQGGNRFCSKKCGNKASRMRKVGLKTAGQKGSKTAVA